jgi:hypothetical protein
MSVDWEEINRKYPSKLDKSKLSDAEFRKERTLELYSYLPQTTLEERFEYTDIRDAVIELNYKFFGYLASHHYIASNYCSYEDKFQSAATHFCEMWHKFMFAPKYRTDLSFAVFFKPRITECMERELQEVKYSVRRTLCMKVGEQVGKHWAQVTYDDLKNATLSPQDMASLQAIFGALYTADLETHAMFTEAPTANIEGSYNSDCYDSLVDMLKHEMVVQEKDLDDQDLLNLAMLLDVPYEKLKKLMPEARESLYNELHLVNDINETFSA